MGWVKAGRFGPLGGSDSSKHRIQVRKATLLEERLAAHPLEVRCGWRRMSKAGTVLSNFARKALVCARSTCSQCRAAEQRAARESTQQRGLIRVTPRSCGSTWDMLGLQETANFRCLKTGYERTALATKHSVLVPVFRRLNCGAGRDGLSQLQATALDAGLR